MIFLGIKKWMKKNLLLRKKNIMKKESQKKSWKLPKFINIPEVVRVPRIHYYDASKIGTYLAIKLENESCMFEEAFDAGL